MHRKIVFTLTGMVVLSVIFGMIFWLAINKNVLLVGCVIALIVLVILLAYTTGQIVCEYWLPEWFDVLKRKSHRKKRL